MCVRARARGIHARSGVRAHASVQMHHAVAVYQHALFIVCVIISPDRTHGDTPQSEAAGSQNASVVFEAAAGLVLYNESLTIARDTTAGAFDGTVHGVAQLGVIIDTLNVTGALRVHAQLVATLADVANARAALTDSFADALRSMNTTCTTRQEAARGALATAVTGLNASLTAQLATLAASLHALVSAVALNVTTAAASATAAVNATATAASAAANAAARTAAAAKPTCTEQHMMPHATFIDPNPWRPVPTGNPIWNITTVRSVLGVPLNIAWFRAAWRPTYVSDTMVFNALDANGHVLLSNYTFGSGVTTALPLGLQYGTPTALPGATMALRYTSSNPATFTSYPATTRIITVLSYCALPN